MFSLSSSSLLLRTQESKGNQQNVSHETGVETKQTPSVFQGWARSNFSFKTSGRTSYWPGIGASFGVISAAAYNIIKNQLQESNIVDNSVCALMKGNPVLSTINFAKQLEIKTFAPLTPVLVAAGYTAYKLAVRNAKSNGSKFTLREQLNHEIKNLPWEEFIKTGVLVGSLMVINNLFGALLSDFDPSGHVMMTTAATYGISSVITHIKKSDCSKLAVGVAGVTAVANAIFMANTTACFHTGAEVISGAAIALATTAVVDTLKIDVSKIYNYLKKINPTSLFAKASSLN